MDRSMTNTDNKLGKATDEHTYNRLSKRRRCEDWSAVYHAERVEQVRESNVSL